MGKPDAPTPPNPYQTAQAQTGTNVSTAVANSYLNNINQVTPQGSLNYDVTGTYSWTDPSTGASYNIPRFTSTQTLSPQQQLVQAQNEGTQLNLATMGNQQSQRVSNLLSTPFNPLTGAPDRGYAESLSNSPSARMTIDDAGQIQKQIGKTQGNTQYNFGAAGPIQSTFGAAGDITRGYGPADNFSADRQRVEDSLMARMNPQLQIEQSRIQQQLADQGIRYGSQAYTSAMDNYNRQANDARYGAINQAGTEQQRMMDMAAQEAGFQNSAQQQAYTQEQGRGTFANAAQGQTYQQALGRGTFTNAAQQQDFQQQADRGAFANAAQGQQFNQNLQEAQFYNQGAAQNLNQQQSVFNASNSARNQYLQEQYAQRNQPLNEISALMSGGAVQAPSWLNSPTSQIPTTDIGGMINQNFAQQQGNYQTANSNWQQMMGGIMGLGAGAIMRSDRDVKKNIDRVGTVFAYNEDAEREKLPIYEYEYKDSADGAGRRVGPMAQDVEKLDRGAVRTIKGVKHINAPRVMGNILRAV